MKFRPPLIHPRYACLPSTPHSPSRFIHCPHRLQTHSLCQLLHCSDVAEPECLDEWLNEPVSNNTQTCHPWYFPLIGLKTKFSFPSFPLNACYRSVLLMTTSQHLLFRSTEMPVGSVWRASTPLWPNNLGPCPHPLPCPCWSMFGEG